MYEKQDGRDSKSRSALAQGLWPRFPGLSGPAAVRVSKRVSPAVVAAN
jgi:soluble lytic murein transglycosylase